MSESLCPRCGRALSDATAGPLCDTCAAAFTTAPSTPADAAAEASRGTEFRPWITYGLIALNILVYLLMVASGASPTKPTPQQLIRWGADFGPLTLTSQPWRMVSAAFVHIGIVHIFFNMVCLYSLGSLAEAIYKRTAYAFMYVLSGVAGSLVSLIVYPVTVSAGASGAIFGIVGALIAAFKMGRLRLPPQVVKSQLTNLFVFAGFNLLYGAVRPGLNNAAHLGGLAGGLLMGIIIAVAVRNRTEYRRARNAAITLMIVIVVGGYSTVRELHAYTIQLDQARNALARGQWDEARAELEAATRRRPHDALAFSYLGSAYTRLGDFPRAEAALRRSVELNPRDAGTRFKLAVVYFTEKKFADAADTMRQLVQMQPNDPDMHEFLAQVLAEQGSAAEAQQEHARAMELQKNRQQQ
jgi:membrane associated rhomboid family serine protease/Flp pilus assembly protein TadD